MNTIHIDGSEARVKKQPTSSRVYALPLNTTSAINIQLFSSRQDLSAIQNVPLATSASTYIGGSQHPELPRSPELFSVVINTDDDKIEPTPYPSAVPSSSATRIQTSLTDINRSVTDSDTEEGSVISKTSVAVSMDDDDPHVKVTSPRPSRSSTGTQYDGSADNVVHVSVGSEPNSPQGSFQDETASLPSSGSQTTSGSLIEGVASLNLTAPNGGGITAVTVSQKDRHDYACLLESTDSQLSASDSPGSPTSPTGTELSNDKRKPRFTKKKIPLSWEDDVGSDKSFDIKVMDASAFILDDFTEEETKTITDADKMKGTRIALYKGQTLTAMLKVKCSSEDMGCDLRLLMLLRDILIKCDKLGHRMKGSAVRLTPYHLNKMKLDDGRPSKEHAAEVARQLEGDLVLCEAVCQKHEERIHIATEIKDRVYEKGPFQVGKLGILVTLWKKHKYSVAAEFSGPLCDHICFYRPHLLGSTSGSALKRKRKATDTVRRVFQSPDLLSQMFKTDPTITVAEAARRSFVEIIFYVLYE